MEIKTNRDELLTCLEHVKDAASSTGINPILSNVLIKTDSKRLTMTTTNHEIQMEASCQLTAGEKLERILPVDKLQSVLRALSTNMEVSISFKKNEALITAGRTKFKLMTSETEKFSLLGETSEMTVLETISGVEFQKSLKKVAYAAAQKSHRMNLNGVLLERTVSGTTFVATDGHRLAMKTISVANNEESTTHHILPRRTVEILIQRLTEEEPLEISVNDRVVRFKTTTFELISNVIQETYPDYQAVIPRANDKKAIIERKSLLSAMRHVTAVAERNASVTLSFSENKLEVECLSKDSDSLNDWLDIRYEGEMLPIRFNINFVQDVLNAMEEDIIEMYMQSNSSSVLIKAADDDSFNYVLMPVNT